MTTCGWTGGKWRWECTAHGGLRNSTWNLVSSNGDIVLEGVKGVELVKNDKYTKLVRAAPQLYEELAELLSKVEREECHHESTHRGGAIWTFCNDCGKKWADDEGGFVPYVEPPYIAKARAALAAARGEG